MSKDETIQENRHDVERGWSEKLVLAASSASKTALLVLALFLVAGASPILPKLATLTVSVPTVILLVEVVKLCLVLLFLWLFPLFYNGVNERRRIEGFQPVRRRDMLRGMEWSVAVRFGGIALLYLFVNNLKLFAQLQLDPGTFTLLNNLSILTTAVLFRFVMKRRLTTYQICALILVVMGLVTSKLTIVMGLSHSHHVALAVTQGEKSFLTGLIVMLIAALCSSLADVAVEFSFKRYAHKQHFVAQSLVLYAFGAVWNTFAICVFHWNDLAEEYARVLEMSFGVWAIVIMSAFNGILVGLVFRFAVGGNITKIFADAGALFLTLLLAAIVLHDIPGFDLICGLVVIYVGIFIYSTQAAECERLNGSHNKDVET